MSAKRLVTRQSIAGANGQQAKALLESLAQSLNAEQLDTRSGELDGQRQSVELAADVSNGRAIARVDLELSVHRSGALSE